MMAVAAALLSGMALAAEKPGRPLLVTVDDLPVGAGRLHTDVAERRAITEGLLAVLEKHGVKAVGFVVWGNVKTDADREILERWLGSGHELGNHSHGHLDFSRTDAETYIADVEAGRAGLQTLLDGQARKVRFFRFPFLREGETEAKLDAMRAYLARSGQTNLQVTIDNQDWSFEERWVKANRAGDAAERERIGDEYQLALRTEILTQSQLGDELFERTTPQVLLLHANAVGAAQWDALFSWTARSGYRFAAADEVLADSAITAPHRFVNGYGGSLWFRVRRERDSEKARSAVAAVLAEQAAAWSRGDLEAFCSVYADDAVFVSPSGLTKGRQAVLERYKSRYASPQAMGALTLEPLDVREAWGNEVSPFGDALPSRTHAVTIAARWTLRREGENDSTGLTLLVLQRRAGKWVIVQDASM
jgi:peptidoglycan-N-acetylglucosamine deacetylase